jgi:hypothetical protein
LLTFDAVQVSGSATIMTLMLAEGGRADIFEAQHIRTFY